MFGKIGALSFFVIWLRATYPRLREDQLQRFAWLVLIPLSLVMDPGRGRRQGRDRGRGRETTWRSDDTDMKDQPESGVGPGLLKGLGVTLKTMLQPAVTQQYPHVKPDLPARTRGVIALKQENCTVCYKCSRECPDWCIYIDAHKERTTRPAAGARVRRRSSTGSRSTTRCACTAASASRSARSTRCSGAPSSSTRSTSIDLMTHEKERLEEWTYTVLPPPAARGRRRADGRRPPCEDAS